jgi:nicotinamidase-related amidase
MPAATALLIVDVQLGMLESPLIPPVSQGDELLTTLKNLITRARDAGAPIIYVQHCGMKGHPLEEGAPQWQVHPAIRPREEDVVIHKHYCDSFYKTELNELLHSKSISHLVVAGIQTELCVDTACRRAFSLGYEVTLVEDGHSTWDTEILKAGQIVAHHNATLASSFVKLAKSDSLFQSSSLKVVVNR